MELVDWRPGHNIDLVIGEESWRGVLYRRYGRLMMYIVGELPTGWNQFVKCTYNVDGQLFNIIGYMNHVNELDREVREKYHPFGNSWIMQRVLHTTYPVVRATIE